MWPAKLQLGEHDEVLVESALAVSLQAVQDAPENPIEWIQNNSANVETFLKKCRGNWVSIKHKKSVKSDNHDRNIQKWFRKHKALIDKMTSTAVSKRQASKEEDEIEGHVRLEFFDQRHPARISSSKNAKRQKCSVEQQVVFVPKNKKKGKDLPNVQYTDLSFVDKNTNLQVKLVKEPNTIPESVVLKANLPAEAETSVAQKMNCLTSSLIHMAVSSFRESKTPAAYKELTKEARNQHLSKMFGHLKKSGGLVSEESEIERFLHLVESKEKIRKQAKEEKIKESHLWIKEFQYKSVRAKLGRCCLCSTTKLMSCFPNLTLQDWSFVQKEDALLESASCIKCKKDTNHQLLFILSHNYLLIEPKSIEYPRPPKKSFKDALDMFKEEVQIGGVDFFFCSAMMNLWIEKSKDEDIVHSVLVTKKNGRFDVTCDCQDLEKWSVEEKNYKLGLLDKKVYTKLVLYRRKE
ncbi:uncharacterized protein LOC132196690 [Neocloeon triangulifer]|uniref:uncharacterized protein LOC132196690 n=1 Tax=Neocloeon triangulifer TaxID=2078957 RepID=UPI00286F26BD|nr:uncharacterized protein LOC132196690 [Neocloeon triangulifer]